MLGFVLLHSVGSCLLPCRSTLPRRCRLGSLKISGARRRNSVLYGRQSVRTLCMGVEIEGAESSRVPSASRRIPLPSSVEDIPMEEIPSRVEDIPRVWARPGVYGVYNTSGILQYVGGGKNVAAELRRHLVEIGKKDGRLGATRVILFERDVEQDLLDEVVYNWVVTHAMEAGLPPGNAHEEAKWRRSSGIRDVIQQLVDRNRVVCFIKGTREMPTCGFSQRMVAILTACLGNKFSCVDCLDEVSYPGMRAGIKEFSEWPTIPQLYVDGEFIGGSDVVQEMYMNDSVQELFEPILNDQDPAPGNPNAIDREKSGMENDLLASNSEPAALPQFIDALWDKMQSLAPKELRDIPLERIPISREKYPRYWARTGVYGIYSWDQELRFVGQSQDVRASLLRLADKMGAADGRMYAVRMRTYPGNVSADTLENLVKEWVGAVNEHGSGIPYGDTEE